MSWFRKNLFAGVVLNLVRTRRSSELKTNVRIVCLMFISSCIYYRIYYVPVCQKKFFEGLPRTLMNSKRKKILWPPKFIQCLKRMNVLPEKVFSICMSVCWWVTVVYDGSSLWQCRKVGVDRDQCYLNEWSFIVRRLSWKQKRRIRIKFLKTIQMTYQNESLRHYVHKIRWAISIKECKMFL